MANKKITVVGEGAEEPLTPEEEHSIEVRVDQMLDPAVPDQPANSVKSEPPTQQSTEVANTPKVTKIITKFADEPAETDEPTPEPSVKSTPKTTAKKITIKHHDDEAGLEAPSSESQAPKPPVKKLQVVIADGSEPDDLVTKAAAIADSAQAAEEMINAKQVADAPEAVFDDEPEKPASEAEPVPADVIEPDTDESEASLDSTEDRTTGAPPLIQKHEAAPIGAIDDEPAIEAETTAPLPSLDSRNATKVKIDEPAELSEDALDDVENSSEPTADIPEPKPTPAAPAAPLDAPAAERKYRPPEGPMQFKRAEVPIQPYKPGEPRPVESSASELSEDEALAQAFEAPKNTAKREKTGYTTRRWLKLFMWVIVLAILAAAAAAALPSLRHRALNLVGLDKPTPAKTVSNANPGTVVPVTALSPDVYVAKRDAIYNIYQADPSGQNEKLVLAGTGNEASGLIMAPNATSTYAALVSTRDGKKNRAGALKQSMALVDVTGANKPVTLDTADQVKLVDWFGSRLVYVLLSTSTSTSDPNRYQIISYDTATKTRMVLDHMNYLNDIVSAKGAIYYATAASATTGGQFGSVKPDGSAKQIIMTSEVAAITRTSYNDLTLSTINKWYAYHLGDTKATATNNIGQTAGRLYIDSPDGKHSAYLNSSSDASQLVIVDTGSGQETPITVTGASYPLHWLSNDTIVYRRNGADYSVKLTGSTPVKIADVADVAGVGLWHDQ